MRITIVGQGFVSAAGVTPGRSGDFFAAPYRTWTTEAATGLPVYPVTLPRPTEQLAAFLAGRTVSRAAELALHAADRAVPAAWRGTDFPILVGCSRGPTDAWESHHAGFLAEGQVPPRTSPRTTLGSLAFVLADYYNNPGLATALSVTCSSGLHALLQGVALLRAGMADRVLVGGAEAPLTPFTLAQMQSLRVYAAVPANDGPACRPFAAPSSGMALGEGAGFLALERCGDTGLPNVESLGFARETGRGATGMSPTGEGFQRAMRMALRDAPDTPGAVVAHAPGTRLGDAAERHAITTVLGESIPLWTGKPLTGHTFGASGPLGLEVALAGDARRVLVNAAGFGGNFVSVLIHKPR